MTDEAVEKSPSVADAHQEWRVPDRAAAKSALAAMTLAEASALKTANAVGLAALSTRADVADADATSAMADFDEAEAQGRYREASDRVARNRAE